MAAPENIATPAAEAIQPGRTTTESSDHLNPPANRIAVRADVNSDAKNHSDMPPAPLKNPDATPEGIAADIADDIPPGAATRAPPASRRPPQKRSAGRDTMRARQDKTITHTQI